MSKSNQYNTLQKIVFKHHEFAKLTVEEKRDKVKELYSQSKRNEIKLDEFINSHQQRRKSTKSASQSLLSRHFFPLHRNSTNSTNSTNINSPEIAPIAPIAPISTPAKPRSDETNKLNAISTPLNINSAAKQSTKETPRCDALKQKLTTLNINSASKPSTKETPRCDALKQKLNNIEIEMNKLNKLKKMYKGNGCEHLYNETRNRWHELHGMKTEIGVKLKKRVSRNKYMKQWRINKRNQEKLIKEMESAGNIQLPFDYKVRDKSGQPLLELTKRGAGLREAIKRCADPLSEVDPRRRSEIKTLNSSFTHFANLINDDLELAQNPISRSAIRARTRPPNVQSHSEANPSTHFTLSLRKNVDSFAARLSGDTIYVGIDDKARIPIGITIAEKHGKLLGSRHVRLSDHDFPYGPSHGFICSVYCVFEISDEGHADDHKRVTWSGPTLVVLRSAYHEHQSAFNHAKDIQDMIHDERFQSITYKNDKVKSILITSGDTGPDEACRNAKVQRGLLWLMKQNQFDTVMARNSASGQSRKNRIERKMAPISSALAGKCLPIFKYGMHIKNGVVVDEPLALKNFNYAGQLLADNLNGRMHDGFPMYAKYVEPLTTEEIKERDDTFYALPLLQYQTVEHWQGSKYFCQFINCLQNDDECTICTKESFTSKILTLYPCLKMYPPLVWDNINMKLQDPEQLSSKKYHFCTLSFIMSLNIEMDKKMHFDTYDEGNDQNLLLNICPFDYLQFANKTSMLRHRRFHHSRKRAPKLEEKAPEFDLETLISFKIKNVDIILRADTHKYYCKLNDGTFEWLFLSRDHPKVSEWEDKLKRNNGIYLLDTNEGYQRFYELVSDEEVTEKPKERKKPSRKETLQYDSDEYDVHYIVNKEEHLVHEGWKGKQYEKVKKRKRVNKNEESDVSTDDDVPIVKRRRKRRRKR